MLNITNLVQYYLNAVIFMSLTVYISILFFDIERLTKNSMIFISEIVTYSQYAIFISLIYMFRFFIFSNYVMDSRAMQGVVLFVLLSFVILFVLSLRFISKKQEKRSSFLTRAIFFSTILLSSFIFEHEYLISIYNIIILVYSAFCFMFCFKVYRQKIIQRSYGIYCMMITAFSLICIRFVINGKNATLFLSLDTGLAVFGLLGLFLFFTHYSNLQREEYIHSLKKKNDTIKKMYYYDELVECENFRAFEEEILNIKIDEYIMVMNIKNFMSYNNLMGYAQGDELLKKVVGILKEILPKDYKIYRQYADKFIISCSDDSLSIIEKHIKEIYRSLYEEQSVGYKVEVYFGLTKHIHESVKEEDYSNLFVKELEIASSIANEKKSVYYEVTKPDLEYYEKQTALQNDLHKAIENKEFVVYYQPQVDKKSLKVISLEALVRWKHGDEIIAPGFFIDYAEENGFILDITKQVVEHVFNDIVSLDFMKKLKVSINISPVHLIEEEFYQYFKHMLHKYAINPDQIVLELTENVLISDTEQVVEGIKRIKNLGVQLSLDDFGTGYSSLHRFTFFDFDEIKFDKSFIDNINTDENLNDFLKLVTFFKSSSMRIVVEGVETKEQYQILQGTTIDYYQGYYFYKPQSVTNLCKIFL